MFYKLGRDYFEDYFGQNKFKKDRNRIYLKTEIIDY